MRSTSKTKKLSKEFIMKDLGVAKQIHGMRITKENDILTLSSEEYVKKVFRKFNMVGAGAKPVSILLASHFQLSKDQLPLTKQEWVYMVKVSYVFAIDNLICAQLRLDFSIEIEMQVEMVDDGSVSKWEIVKMCEA
ncbi:Retrovirus-related Pol polyprotein from transposon TNT 1-94 [Vitis vinifera]|uniref:Retrovirus-related Pol polyprotein from transposon TNT 1-94 n=1 Tax=Vitis vinifera TaxID=29760 RepID=A0A438DFZ8_VITVI|nr:Retrovirus-related Pol polyprotein from transposon TNT 1-94 [Vitis vinifera]